MKKQSNDILNIFSEIDPPVGLKETVFKSIEKERQKQVFRKKMLYGLGFFACVSTFLFSGIFFGREILASDFWSISSLSFSDPAVISTHWQDFSFSLLETFPAEDIAFVLVPIFILLVLARQYYEYLQDYKSLTNSGINI